MAYPKSLTFAVIGIGYFGKHYVRLLQEIEGAELRAIAARSEESLGRFSFLPPSVRRTTDTDEIFKDPSIECVVIATPPRTHLMLAKAALKFGKHVLLEKPMVASVEEAYALRDAVKESGKIFMVGHQYLYNDHIRHLKQELDRGRLGAPRLIFAEHLYPGQSRSDIGCFWECATHKLAMIEYLFGAKDVEVLGGKTLSFSGSPSDDFAAVQIQLQDGPLAAIIVSWFVPEKTRRLMVMGSEGTALFDDVVSQDKLKFSSYKMSGEDGVEVPKITAREPLRNELEHFIECVRNNTVPLTDAMHGVRITELLDKIYKRIYE